MKAVPGWPGHEADEAGRVFFEGVELNYRGTPRTVNLRRTRKSSGGIVKRSTTARRAAAAAFKTPRVSSWRVASIDGSDHTTALVWINAAWGRAVSRANRDARDIVLRDGDLVLIGAGREPGSDLVIDAKEWQPVRGMRALGRRLSERRAKLHVR